MFICGAFLLMESVATVIKLEWIKRSYLSGRHVPCEFFVQVALGSRPLLFHEILSVSTPMLSVCSDFRVS